MEIMVRKNGLVILKLSELEAVTLTDVMEKVKVAANDEPEFFNRTQKAVINDSVKTLNGLDKAFEAAEKRAADSTEEEEDASVAAPVAATTEKAGRGKAAIGNGGAAE